MHEDNTLHTLALAGGCFWCIEGIFAALRGVELAESGYSNGRPGPVTYEQVCQGDTGYAEVVLLRYQPAIISCQQLLEVFFTVHDGSQLNRQGADVGTQYRSGIYTTTAQQADCARQFIAQIEAEQGIKIVTEVLPLADYQRAEEGHQNYFALHPQQPYCQAVAAPKMRKAMQHFGHLWRA